MRSFIKAHRRGESASSDFDELDHPRPIHKTPASTPVPSPVVSNGNGNGQFTPPGSMTGNLGPPTKSPNGPLPPINTNPPSTGSSTTQSSLSSPKKLLTPIKKMFSSSTHTKVTTPSSNDSLQNAVNGRTKRKLKAHRHSRSSGSVPEYSEGLGIPGLNGLTNAWEPSAVATAAAVAATTKYSNRLANSSGLNSSASSPALANTYKQVPAAAPVSQSHTSISSFQSSGSHPSTIPSLQTKLKPPILLESPSFPGPVKELDTPENSPDSAPPSLLEEDKTESKQVSFNQQLLASPPIENKSILKSGPVYNNSDDELEEEYEGDDSDSSSQFSFVKDMNCGRNTSVKYYKTVKTPQLEDGEFESSNTYGNDLGSDVEGLSDYDFENNGLDDDDFHDDEDVQYNKLFDDEDGGVEDKEDIEEDVESVYDNDDTVVHDQISVSDDQVIDSYQTADDEIQEAYTDSNKDTLVDQASPEDTSHASDKTVSESAATQPTMYQLNSESDRKVFHKSYHLSIQGPESLEESQVVDTDPYEDDILENYLDVSNSPTVDMSESNSSHKTPEPSSSDDIELFEVSSPIINGLTFGNNLRHRLPKLNSNDSERELSNSNVFIHRSVLDLNQDPKLQNPDLQVPSPDRQVLHLRALKSFHGSISDDLNTKIIEKTKSFDNFANLQEATKLVLKIDAPQEKLVEPPKHITTNPRHSVNELMNLLSNLETPHVERSDEKSKEQALDDTLSSLEQPSLPSKEIKTNRSSILGMMNLLSDLEKAQLDIVEENNRAVEKAQQNRKSILDMMSTLSSLENNASTVEEAKSKRNSINNMMQTLASLDLSGSVPSASEKLRNKNIVKGPLGRLKISDAGKRYSWFNNDESVNFNSPKVLAPVAKISSLRGESNVSESENEHSDTEAYNRTFDQDLIDEINQLPEDFDFEDLNYHNSAASAHSDGPNFLRSNSYNKKPVKAVIDNKYQCNKIETTNKTVTFYRSNSTSASIETNRSRSVSRAPSIRSMNSFTSVNEEQEEEEEGEGDYFGSARASVGEQPYPFKFNRGLKPTHSFTKPKVSPVSKTSLSFR